jgi:GNAT superfamily N-acetyltransferase
MKIRPLDPHDDAEATAWYAALRAGAAHGRTAPLVVSATALLTSLRTAATNPAAARHPYGAWDGATCVGVLLVDLPLIENAHVAEVDVTVPPEHRRRGVGAALFDAAVGIARDNRRTLLTDEVHVPEGVALDAHPGGRFALARGFAAVHTEQHLVLDVPVPDERLAALGAYADAASGGYATVT